MLRRFKNPIIILLVLSLVLGLGAVGFMVIPGRLSAEGLRIQISLGSPATQQAAPAGPQDLPATLTADHMEGVLYDMGSKVVNLADPGGYRYLKIAIVLEILPADTEFYTASGEAREEAERHVQEELDKQRPIIEDTITIKLSGKTFEEVFTIAGKEQLKEELQEEMNARLTAGQVREIYFTEFVIQ